MKYEKTDQVKGLRCRTITHENVNGKEILYLRVWNDNDDDESSVLINIGRRTFDKICGLVKNVDYIQEGGGNVLDNDSKKC